MTHYEAINDVLVNLFNEIMDLEERALITPEYKDISVNDMHIIDAVGIQEQKNMSSVARALGVTVGTLTTAMNNLVKKGYIYRTRSQKDRRVVLVSLSEKGEKAYYHHKDFHEKMVLAVLKDLNAEETEVLTEALVKLQKFFRSYQR
ncbi:MAG: MarR family transcriptional regulator [Clostridia bacterium]|nr:MarR family transcriptional regulator [Clostridia bacterium]MDY5555838.1 MarR family transcriptional regulator [Blautia sp.]